MIEVWTVHNLAIEIIKFNRVRVLRCLRIIKSKMSIWINKLDRDMRIRNRPRCSFSKFHQVKHPRTNCYQTQLPQTLQSYSSTTKCKPPKAAMHLSYHSTVYRCKIAWWHHRWLRPLVVEIRRTRGFWTWYHPQMSSTHRSGRTITWIKLSNPKRSRGITIEAAVSTQKRGFKLNELAPK